MDFDKLENLARTALIIKDDKPEVWDVREFCDGVLALVEEARRQPAPYHVPGPYEIALAVAQGLCASGKYDSPSAAMGAAWTAVPAFFAGRNFYVTELAPVLYGLSPTEGAPDGHADA